jgi:(p)ppGpp synthase/HD superfamily hydrolase
MRRKKPASKPLARKKRPGPRKIFAQMNLPVSLRDRFAFLLYWATRVMFFYFIEDLEDFSKAELRLIKKAYDVAEREFDGENRKSGERYFEHLRRCALILIIHYKVRDANMVAAMLLHDIIEMKRREWNVVRLTVVFNADVAMLVWWLTKPPLNKCWPTKALVNRAYWRRLARAPRRVVILKSADRDDNLLTLWAKSLRKVRQILADTEKYIIPVKRKHRVPILDTLVMIKYIRKELLET